MIQTLFQHLKHYYHLSTEVQNAIADCVEEQAFDKHTLLITEGKICRHIYFRQQGALRGFYDLEG